MNFHQFPMELLDAKWLKKSHLFIIDRIDTIPSSSIVAWQLTTLRLTAKSPIIRIILQVTQQQVERLLQQSPKQLLQRPHQYSQQLALPEPLA